MPKMQALSGYVRRLGASAASGGTGRRRWWSPSSAVGGGGGARQVEAVTRHHKRTPGGEKARIRRAEGRSHLKRANALAGEGDCEAAIEEYTKAYDMLDDPVVLFNRGECYRRTGDCDNAVDDYREFLEKVPSAPNRADIEAKIAILGAPRRSLFSPSPQAAPGPAPPPAVARPARPRPRPEPAAAPVAVKRTAEAAAADTRRRAAAALVGVDRAGRAGRGGRDRRLVMFRPQESQPPDSMWGNYRF